MRVLGIVIISLSGTRLVEHNVMPFIDSRTINPASPESSHNHFRVLVSREARSRAYNGPIHVALIVEDSASSTPPTDEIHSS